MKERYTRLFTAEEDLHAENAPLLIEKGALLRDNTNGEVLVQLKIRNLEKKTVLAVKLRLYPEDTAGRPLGEALEHDFLDLHVERGGEFGPQSPVKLPNPATRSFRAEPVEVIFADRSVWTATEDAKWEPLPAGKSLESALGDQGLAAECRQQYGKACRFLPVRCGELWRCTCGRVVKGERCPSCGGEWFEPNTAALAASRDQRAAKEKAARERAKGAGRGAAKKGSKTAARKEKILGLILVSGLLVLLTVGFLLFGLPIIREMKSGAQAADHAEETEAAALEAPEESAGEEAEDPSAENAEGVNFAAIYALHDPEEVVMTIDGREITWQDYFYAYYNQAVTMEQSFLLYQQYGVALNWESQADEEGHTYAEILATVSEQDLRRVITAETVAEEEQIRLLPEEEAEVQSEHQNFIVSFCGESGTEEQLFEKLREERYLSRGLYWRILRYGPLTNAIRRVLYGADGEKLSEEQVLTWMEEQGILSADHILISTLDAATNQPLDEAEVARRAELARQIAEELQAIEDPAEREARFLELKAEYGEDPGAAEGYVFGPGIMITEFYEGALALENGQISDPIQTQYGFHIILRRPIHADDMVVTASGNQTANALMAETLFSTKMQERYDAQVIEYVPGFEPPYILDYYTKPLA